jgi:hypothetical protein
VPAALELLYRLAAQAANGLKEFAEHEITLHDNLRRLKSYCRKPN